jgi:hypothetical protein
MFNGYSWQSRVLEVRLDRLPSDFDNFSSPASDFHTPLISSHAPLIPGLRPPYAFPTVLPPPINPLSSASFVPQVSLRGPQDESSDYSTVYGYDRPTAVGGISRNLFVGNVGLLRSLSTPIFSRMSSYHFIVNGKISRTSSVKRVPFFVRTSLWAKMAALAGSVLLSSPRSTMLNVR